MKAIVLTGKIQDICDSLAFKACMLRGMTLHEYIVRCQAQRLLQLEKRQLREAFNEQRQS